MGGQLTLDGFLEQSRAALGDRGVVTAPADLAPYAREWRGRYDSAPAAVILPETCAQTALVMRLAREARLPIVPQGGNTGLVGGSVADAGSVILATGRMRQVRVVDAAAGWMIAEAGVTLAEVRRVALAHDRHYPLQLPSEGSCTVGGTLSANAGGAAVLRYGMARAQVLGVEAVLPDGTVFADLAGRAPHLHHLLLGAEGTLGVITAARLRLFPAIRDQATAYIGVPDPAHAIALLARLRAAGETVSGEGALSAFELMNRQSLDLVLRHMPGTTAPLATPSSWGILAAFTAPQPAQLTGLMSAALEAALLAGEIEDAVVAHSDRQAAALWHLREQIATAQTLEGASIKHDIAVPVAAIPIFITHSIAAVEALIAGARVVAFGHAGDGNIHFNVTQPKGADPAIFLAHREEVNALVHDQVATLKGSISAEHGIGRAKRAALRHYKPEAIAILHKIKQAFDSQGLCNPGVVL